MRVIVKEMTRDEAIIQMVDANLQGEHILPSERAMAYAQMRRVSDDLCRLRGLSVIAQENGCSQHYGQWIAEQAGAPTWRSAIRADVDRAIAQSMTWNAFLSHLERQGYGIKTGVKHTAVRPPGKERFVRFRSLGDAYTEEAIRNRILGQRRPASSLARPAQPRRVRIQGSFRLCKITWKGLRALYYHYLMLLRKARRQDMLILYPAE